MTGETTFYETINYYREVIAKVRNLPFDRSTGSRLRVNGLRLKSLTFSVCGELVEPQKNTFAIGSRVKKWRVDIPLAVSAVLCFVPA